MAALAVPLIEAAAMALLRALGVATVAAAGGVAIDEASRERARRKAESADKSKDLPVAQAGTQARAREACSKCPPDCGALVERRWNMSEMSRAYQARITGFAPHTEWSFEKTDFDGFRPQACLLLEAKGLYDQFFTAAAKPKPFFEFTGLPKLTSQAIRQSEVVWAHAPSQLHWHFMQPLSWAYFAGLFKESLLPIITFLTP